MSDEQKLEEKIQEKGLNAPRLTPDHIDSKVLAADYQVMMDKTVVCCLKLVNGFTIVRDSAAVSKENMNFEIGSEVAFEKARNEIWGLEGYLLQEKLYQKELEEKKGPKERLLDEKAYFERSLFELGKTYGLNSNTAAPEELDLLLRQKDVMTELLLILDHRLAMFDEDA